MERIQRVLEVGPDVKDSAGGMASVIKEIIGNKSLQENFILDSFGSFCDGPKPKRLAYCLSAYLRYRTVVKDYDIVHIHMTAGMSAWRKSWYIETAKKLNKKVVIQLHTTDYFIEQYNKRDDRYKERVNKVLHDADRILVLSEEFREKLEKEFSLDNTIYFPNSIDPDDYTFSLPDNNKLVFLGKLNEDKGVDVLIDALARLKHDYGMEPECLLAGSGDKEKYQGLIDSNNLVNCHISDHWLNQSEVKQILSDSSILVLPSQHEGFPIVILQAMASGMTVIATDVGAIPEILSNEQLISVNDPKGLENKIHSLLEDTNKIKNQALMNRKVLEEKFTDEIVMNQLGEVYSEL